MAHAALLINRFGRPAPSREALMPLTLHPSAAGREEEVGEAMGRMDNTKFTSRTAILLRPRDRHYNSNWRIHVWRASSHPRS